MDPALSFSGVRLRRRSFSLDLPSLFVPSDAVVGLVGRNGAGKSSLIDLAAGLLAPQMGEVRSLGLNPASDEVAVRSKVARMTDDEPLVDLPVSRLFDLLAPFYKSWDRELCERLRADFGVSRQKRPSEMSKGEATRLRLVLAMAWRPALLLLDEPGTGLDVVERRKMLTEVLAITREPGRTVLISSHQVDDIERIADWAIVLNEGRVLRTGPMDEVVPPGKTLEQLIVEVA